MSDMKQLGLQWVIVVLASLAQSASFGQVPSKAPAGVSTATRPAADAKQASGDAAPTDAEKIARLQRSIDDAARQLGELQGKLNDPSSEFAQAESEFTKLDRQLAQLQQERDSLPEHATPARGQEIERELGDLKPKHRLAKERFDLAIRERKALQEQIGTLEQKIQRDTEVVKRLKGESPPTTQPAAETVQAMSPDAPPTPANGGAAPAPQTQGVKPQVPGLPSVIPGAAAGTNDAAAERPSRKEPPPELAEARQEANRKQAEAQSAQAEVASITERINALRKSIDLEQGLFETSRKKADNAQETERTLYDTLQRKLEEGVPRNELGDLRRQISEARERLRASQVEIHERTDRLNRYQAELADLQAEHIKAMEESEHRYADAEQAQKRVERLESPFSPQNVWRWLLDHGVKVIGIILAMAAVLWASRLGEGRVVRVMVGRSRQGGIEDRENRAKTLVSIFRSAAAVVVYAGGGLMILTEFGVNIVPLLGGAAVFGLAVAFGAQNLIRDYFYGFMILLENQYTVNDVVRIGDVSGQVERITLRVTVLRSLDGTVHIIPNGEITRVSNLTHGWSRALFDIPVAYKEDVDRVMEILMELAKELRRDPEFRGVILDLPEMLGVDEFADSAVIIKFFVKTRPLMRWTVKRELLRRIKRRFDELGIEIPFPQRTVYHRREDRPKDDEMSPFPMAQDQVHHETR